MVDDKETRGAAGGGITQGVSNLFGSTVEAITETVKDAASTLAQVIQPALPASHRLETAVPPVEETYDAPPMTAEEIARHAAADVQPSPAKKWDKRKKATKTPAAKKKANKAAAKKAKTRKTASCAPKKRKAVASKNTRVAKNGAAAKKVAARKRKAKRSRRG